MRGPGLTGATRTRKPVPLPNVPEGEVVAAGTGVAVEGAGLLLRYRPLYQPLDDAPATC